MSEQRVLCVPRRCVENQEPFTPWRSAGWLFRAAKTEMKWLPRHEAEASAEFVQPIPCAFVVGKQEGYYVFRRINKGRADLKARLSLIVGGHIDWEADTPEFPQLVLSTLKREISEELSTDGITSIKPIGVVVDHTSLESSRHIGIVHQLVVSSLFKSLATEEFTRQSSRTGQLCSTFRLRTWHRDLEFDPWSSIIFGDYLAPSHALDPGWQPRLL